MRYDPPNVHIMPFHLKHIVSSYLICVVLLLIAHTESQAQSGPDEPGEIMFVGFNADRNDGFAFVTLVDIEDTYEIYFTDEEWDGSTFNTGEGTLKWTNNTGSTIASGTIITVTDTGIPTVDIGNLTEEDATLDLNASNEILYSYIGTLGTPSVFLSAISNDILANTGGSLSNTGLTTGTHHIEISGDEDVMVHNSDTVGTGTALIELIGNSSNWITQDDTGDQDDDDVAPDFPDDLPSSFTIQYPGGFGDDLRLWVKADAGVTGTTTVTEWLDQSLNINGLDTFAATTEGPELLTEEFNFRPALSFDRSNSERMTIADGIYDTDAISDLHIYVVSKALSNSTTHVIFYESNSDGGTRVYLPSLSGLDNYIDWWPSSSNKLRIDDWGGNFNEPFLWSLNFSTTGTPTGENQNVRRNSLDIGNDATATSFTGTSGNTTIGSAIGNFWDGSISELFAYTGPITASEQQRIESYLSFKYGITLDQTSATDYLASDGTTEMWDKDATNASTYDNDITGIGRDDGSGLGQIKSQSQNTDGVVIIEAESEGTNASPAFVDMDDLEFLTWGNDDGTAVWTTTGAPTGYSLLTRKWAVQEVGEIGTVNVAFDTDDADFEIPDFVTGDDYYLFIDTDSDGLFSDETAIKLYDDGTNGDDTGADDIWSIESIDFATGQTFTIGSASMYPGNVSGNLQLWLKANEGTSTTTDNTSITNWSDISGVGTDAAGTTNFPLFRDDPSFNFNFNPVIVTDGVDDTLATILDPIADSDDFTMFMVSDNENLVTRGATSAGDGWSIKSFSSVTTTSGGVVQEDVTGLSTTTTPTIHSISL